MFICTGKTPLIIRLANGILIKDLMPKIAPKSIDASRTLSYAARLEKSNSLGKSYACKFKR